MSHGYLILTLSNSSLSKIILNFSAHLTATTKKDPSPQHAALEYVRFDGQPIAQQYQERDSKQRLQEDKQTVHDRQQVEQKDKPGEYTDYLIVPLQGY